MAIGSEKQFVGVWVASGVVLRQLISPSYWYHCRGAHLWAEKNNSVPNCIKKRRRGGKQGSPKKKKRKSKDYRRSLPDLIFCASRFKSGCVCVWLRCAGLRWPSFFFFLLYFWRKGRGMVVRDVWGKRNEMLMLQELSQNDRDFFCSSKEFGLSFRMLLFSVVAFLTFFCSCCCCSFRCSKKNVVSSHMTWKVGKKDSFSLLLLFFSNVIRKKTLFLISKKLPQEETFKGKSWRNRLFLMESKSIFFLRNGSRERDEEKQKKKIPGASTTDSEEREPEAQFLHSRQRVLLSFFFFYFLVDDFDEREETESREWNNNR